MILNGTIASLGTKGGISKSTGRAFTIHTVTLDNGTTIEVGFKQPYAVGTYFNRECEFKYGAYKDAGPAPAGAAPSMGVATPTPRPSTPPPAANGRTFPVDRQSPEMSIIRQNALTNARELVSVHMHQDTPMDDKVNEILRIAYIFADFSSGQREVKQAADLAKLNPPTV